MRESKLCARAIADHGIYRDRLIQVTCAWLTDEQGKVCEMDFPEEDPVLVRILDEPLSDVEEGLREALLDTWWPAAAVHPRQLPAGCLVAWVDGPTYHADGSKTTFTWRQYD